MGQSGNGVSRPDPGPNEVAGDPKVPEDQPVPAPGAGVVRIPITLEFDKRKVVGVMLMDQQAFELLDGKHQIDASYKKHPDGSVELVELSICLSQRIILPGEG